MYHIDADPFAYGGPMIRVYIVCRDKKTGERISKYLMDFIKRINEECKIDILNEPTLNSVNLKYTHTRSEEEATDLENVSRIECRKNNCIVYFDNYYEMYNPRTVSRLVDKVKGHEDFIKLNRAEYVRKTDIVGFKGKDIAVTRDMTYIKMSPSGLGNMSDFIKSRH